jgi:hypothetical protein
LRKVVYALVLALCSGCPTDTGNPFTGEARLHAHSSEAARIAVLADGTEARVDGVWLSSGPIDFLADDCTAIDGTTAAPAAGDDYAQPGATQLDVPLTGEPLCAIAVPLVAAVAVPGAPAELVGHSLLVTGTRSGDGATFRIRTARTGSVYVPELVAGEHFAITREQPAVFLGFDVASWIAGAVDLAAAIPVGGLVAIEAGVDDLRLAAFETNLARGIELYDDPDRSGSASAGEAKLAKGTEIR